MATLLTTARMNPALAARVAASVSARPGGAARRFGTRFTAFSRLGVLLSLAALVAVGLWARQRAHSELEATRTRLLAAFEREAQSVTPADREIVARAERWLATLSAGYEGDLATTELGLPLTQLLSRPLLYVRGPLDAFTNPEGTARATIASDKDAFVACLVDPPEARTEKLLLAKVRAGRAGQLETSSSHIRPLREAHLGLPLLEPSWAENVKGIKSFHALVQLEQAFERAPLERAKQALRGELLLALLDEANDPGGVTELDGEHAHFVRIALVDLRNAKLLLRRRLHVDPAWISLSRRAEYSRSLDDCALALDLRQALGAATPSP